MNIKTIFCDIDGTLIFDHNDVINNYMEETYALPGVIETMKQWEKLNYKIILLTSRKKSLREITEMQLINLGIIFDDLIMGIPKGEKYFIQNTEKCYAINIVKNEGFSHNIIND